VGGLIHYDNKDYDNAQAYFEKANKAAGGRSPQAVYFLGLVAYKQGDRESATKYAAQAEQLGYPLSGLRNLLAKSEEATTAASEKPGIQ
jgi:Tfp pilus assembly protein PilF